MYVTPVCRAGHQVFSSGYSSGTEVVVSSSCLFFRCSHCQRLAPTWEELGAAYSEKPVTIAKVDCTQHKAVCDSQNVSLMNFITANLGMTVVLHLATF